MKWAGHHRDHRTPAGWDRGQKTGWNGASLPPGQERKSGDSWHGSHHGR
jgi:hypothetical protein